MLLAEFAAAGADLGRMLVRPVENASRYGVVELANDRVTAFLASASGEQPGLINAGIYAFDRSVLDAVGSVCSLEQEILPRLAADGVLGATRADGYFVDIGVPDDLAKADREIAAHLARPALIFDLDGVLNVDRGWVNDRERSNWIPGGLDAIAAATSRGWHVFVATNQAGVAQGLYTEEDVGRLHTWISEQACRRGGTIDDFRYCPFHPIGTVELYRRTSDWRKPAPGMLLDLIEAWRLDTSRCVLIGDKPSDILAAEAAGIEGRLFPGGNLAAFVEPILNRIRRL
jgi:D,D-heptose 1,7-bisphosphate phosphatase